MDDKLDKKFKIKVYCSKCKQTMALLFVSVTMPEEQVKQVIKSWERMVLSASLNAPRCPKCGCTTFSDCFLGIIFYIEDQQTKKHITPNVFFK